MKSFPTLSTPQAVCNATTLLYHYLIIPMQQLVVCSHRGLKGIPLPMTNYKLLQSVDKMCALRAGYCLLTPGGGGGDMGLGQGSATQPPTHPTPPRGGGGVYALHPHSHTSRPELTSKSLPVAGNGTWGLPKGCQVGQPTRLPSSPNISSHQRVKRFDRL